MVKGSSPTKEKTQVTPTSAAKKLSEEFGREISAKDIREQVEKQFGPICRDKDGRPNTSVRCLTPEHLEYLRSRFGGAPTKPTVTKPSKPAAPKAAPGTGKAPAAVAPPPAARPAAAPKAAKPRVPDTIPLPLTVPPAPAKPAVPPVAPAPPPAPKPVLPAPQAAERGPAPAPGPRPPAAVHPAPLGRPYAPAAHRPPHRGGPYAPTGRRPKHRGGARVQEKPAAAEVKPREEEIRIVSIYPGITVRELAERMRVRETELIKKLFMRGIMANINQSLEVETAEMIAGEFGYLADIEKEPLLTATALVQPTADPSKLKWRPPVVTIMGHVDHGKTSLLDAIRQTHVTEQEAGGITQRIGAYHVTLKDKNTGEDRQIVFLDTPGHEAFTAMRARGARVTDIAVLVVAADDGVMPQTIEAIDHAKAAGVEIVVAINKIDKPGANPDRAMQQLTEYGLVAEKWGGQTGMVPISAKKRLGIDDLLDYILTLADVLELKANPDAPASGVIIEAQMRRGMGPVATVLIQQGTLDIGDHFVVGPLAGKVRAMIDDRGERLKKAGPSIPVEVMGLPAVPQAGDLFQVVAEEREARLIAERRRSAEQRQKALAHRVSFDTLYTQIQEGQLKELNIVVKADVQGSVEAVVQSLNKLKITNVAIRVLHAGAGDISETDILLAAASNALVIGFNVKVDPNIRNLAVMENVDIRTYQVIYKLIEDVQRAMEGLLEPEFEEVELGKAEVRTIFRVDKRGVIAGTYVQEGKLVRGTSVRVLRHGQEVFKGSLEGLRRFKDDVREVTAGYECGISLEKFQDLQPGDLIQAFTLQEKQRG